MAFIKFVWNVNDIWVIQFVFMLKIKMTSTKFPALLGLIALSALAVAAQRVLPAVSKTSIPVNYRGKIAVGDTIIAYGTGMNTGVDYIKAGDTKGRGIPGGERFSSTNFVTAGDKIVLLDPSDLRYHIFDPKTGKVTPVPDLKNRGATQITASGTFVAMVTIDEQKNRNMFAVVDVSGPTPEVVIEQPPWQGVIRIEQVAIDAAGGNLIVSSGDEIARVLFRAGDTEPIPFKIADKGGAGQEPMAISGNNVYYLSRESGQRNLMELNFTNGSVRKLAVNPATTPVAAAGGTVAYFANRDANDRNATEARLVVMKRGAAPAVIVPTNKFIDGSTKNNGLHGFGNSIAITPDGRR
ncbi:hypothetical protein [Leptolyngbya sp. 7M]|uniref:hypothetical protein n=1 Tax=Leptolyngbya sp. 7M TaxID=2812896 RepID=UPI001B8ABB36|nr:hypothetical protein [Leptolyngbya sp. 7M]QYO66908.1 hypothetical protein JVX88_08925 [Leptolyngbya sp. 7M]